MKGRLSHLITASISSLALLMSSCSSPLKQENKSFFQHSITLENAQLDSQSLLQVKLKFSPDGKWFAAFQETKGHHSTLKIWDAHTGKLKYTTQVGGAAGYYDSTGQTFLGFSPDSKTIILTGQAGPIELWDFTKSKQSRRGCSSYYSSLDSVSKNKHSLLIKTESQDYYLCDMNSEKIYFTGSFLGADVVLTDENKLLAITPASFFWYNKKDQSERVAPLVRHNEKNYIGLQPSLKYIDFWTLKLTTEPVVMYPQFQSYFDRDRKHYTLVDLKGKTISQWNYKTKKLNWKRSLDNLRTHDAHFAFNQADQKIAIKSERYLTVIDSQTGNTLWQRRLYPAQPKSINQRYYYSTFSTDGKRIVIERNNTEEIFDSSSGKRIHKLPLWGSTSLDERAYALDPNKEYLLYTTDSHPYKDEKIIVFNLSSKEKVTISGRWDASTLVHSSHGQLALIENSNTIRLWNTGLHKINSDY